MFIKKEIKDLKQFKDVYLPSNKQLIQSLGLKKHEGHPDRVDEFYYGDTSSDFDTKLDALVKAEKTMEKEATTAWNQEKSRRATKITETKTEE